MKDLRKMAHAVFDPLWMYEGVPRRAAYILLERLFGLTEEQAHIRFLTEEQCTRLISVCEKRDFYFADLIAEYQRRQKKRRVIQ